MRISNSRLAKLELVFLCLAPFAVYYFTIESRPHVEDDIRHEKQSLFDNVFTALLKVVEFLNTDYWDLTVDGLYGFRICQGSLIGALHDCSREDFRCPDALKGKLLAIIGRLNELCGKALPYVELEDEGYYNNYLPILAIPFMVEYIPEKWHGFPQLVAQSDRPYNSLTADTCFRDLIGTPRDGDRKSPSCIIVDECWELMTIRGTTGYFNTHQLLYLLFGEHSGCEQTLGDRMRRDVGMSLRDWQRHLCEQIYIDATFRDYNRTTEDTAEDLFLEQSALCGILGFQDFFNDTWIQMVLGWQHSSGCFTHAVLQLNDEEVDQLGTETSEEEIYCDCLSHKTGVAAATLGTYIRYLVSELHAKR